MKDVKYIALLTCSLLIGCFSRQEASQETHPKTVIDKNDKPLIELAKYQNKYEKSNSTKPNIFPYSNKSKIKVYELNCQGECNLAIFRNRISTGKEISRKQFDELILMLKDPDSYGTGSAACFNPKIGFVLYDNEEAPVEFLSICLDCNNYRTQPGKIEIKHKKDNLNGFSLETRDKLRQLFRDWGIDYYGFSILRDDTIDYKLYLDRTNISTSSIELAYMVADQEPIWHTCNKSNNPNKCSETEFYKYISKNIRYTKSEKSKLPPSKIIFTIIIEKDGTTILKEIKPDIEITNLQQIIKSMPKWIPAETNGRKIRFEKSIPLRIN